MIFCVKNISGLRLLARRMSYRHLKWDNGLGDRKGKKGKRGKPRKAQRVKKGTLKLQRGQRYTASSSAGDPPEPVIQAGAMGEMAPVGKRDPAGR
ncbi:MAG: hypothetical protein AABZ47_13125, partial [Planctomycetota bacterium]